MDNIPNPFVIGTVVTGDDFADRIDIIKEIILDCLNGQNIIIHGPRRVGKSSLLKELMRILQQDHNLKVIYIDLLLFDNVETIAGYIFQQLAGSIEKSIELIKSVIKGVVIKFDSSSTLELSLSKPKDIFLKVFDYLGEYSSKKNLVVVFDEFQEIENVAGESISKLRAIIQNHRNISYLFSGSDSRLIDFFTDYKHPFYKFGKIINLGKPTSDEMVKFLQKKFISSEFTIKTPEIDLIISKTLNLPYFIQFLAHEIWIVAKLENIKELTSEVIEKIFDKALERLNLDFERTWSNLSKNQRSTLKILSSDSQPFDSKVLHRYMIAQSSVQTALESLIRNQFVWKVDTVYEFLDPFFESWIKKRY